MHRSLGFILLSVVIYNVTTEKNSPVSIVIKSKSPSTRWKKLMPALQEIKNTTVTKKETLSNAIKSLKHLLADEIEKSQFLNIEYVESDSNLSEYNIETTIITKINNTNHTLNKADEIIGDCVIFKGEINNELPINTYNSTRDFSKILSKIAAAISKVEEQNDCNVEIPIRKPVINDNIVKVHKIPVKTKNGCKKFNSILTSPKFIIPYQKASDILEETSSIPIPESAICDMCPKANLKLALRTPKLILENPSSGRNVPNLVGFSKPDDTVAILFKPKTTYLMQLYGNLLRQTSVTVLIPFHISKLTD